MKNFFPAVSVIVPVFNAEKYLGVCLESILIQTFTDFEVIVVDDCSTDASLTVAENFLERFNGRLKIISLEENTGSGAVPRNVGLNFAHGKYVCFIDNDDLLIDTALEKLYGFAEEYRVEVVCMSKYFSCDEKFIPQDLTIKTWEKDPVPDEPTLETDDIEERVKKFMRFSFIWAPWGKFVRRDFLVANNIKFLKMTIAEDVIHTFELICLAKNFLRVSTPLYVYRETKSSIMRRDRTPEQMMTFRVNPLLSSVDYLNEFMRGQKFFKENTDYALAVLDFFANINFTNLMNSFECLNPSEAYEIIFREFLAAGSSHPALISYLLVMNNLYRNELTKRAE